MRTIVQVQNANCSFCMGEVRERLLASPLVNDVQVSTTGGCWDVDHALPGPAAITDLLRSSLHLWEIADNGEVVEQGSTPVVATECSIHHGRQASS